MKSVWFATLLLLSAGCLAEESDPASGQGRAEAAGRALLGLPAPAVTLQTIDGETIDLAKLYGNKPVYLKFWATWCVPCREQMPAFEKDFEQRGDKIAFVAVNTGFNEKKDAVLRYRREHGLKMPVVIDDGTLAGPLNLRVTPQHVVIGRDGRVLYVGHLEDEQLQRAFDQALSEPAGDAPLNPMKAAARGVTPLSATALDGTVFSLNAPDPKKRVRALMFFSPWCESYLLKSRPDSALACKATREVAERMAKDPQVNWLGIASGLWASKADLETYGKEKAVQMMLTLDEDGSLFHAFGVRDVPTVVLIAADGHVAGSYGPQDSGLASRIHALEQSR